MSSVEIHPRHMNICIVNETFSNNALTIFKTKDEFLLKVKECKDNNKHQALEIIGLNPRAFLDLDRTGLEIPAVKDLANEFISHVETHLGVNITDPSFTITSFNAESYHIVFDFSVDIVTLGFLVSTFRVVTENSCIDDVIYNIGGLFRCIGSVKPTISKNSTKTLGRVHEIVYGNEPFISLPTAKNIVFMAGKYTIVDVLDPVYQANAQEQIVSIHTKRDGEHTKWFKDFTKVMTKNVTVTFRNNGKSYSLEQSEKLSRSKPSGYYGDKPSGYCDDKPSGYCDDKPSGYCGDKPSGYCDDKSSGYCDDKPAIRSTNGIFLDFNSTQTRIGILNDPQWTTKWSLFSLFF